MFIIFDFDDVLFNTAKFKKDFLNLFKEKFNITEEEFEKSYIEARKRNGISNYVFEHHLEILNSQFGLNEKDIKKELKLFGKNLSKYVFIDVEEKLKILKESGHVLFIVTFGSKFIQQMKIDGSGLNYLFRDIMITDTNKGEMVTRLFKKYKIQSERDFKKTIFIDDRISHLQNVNDLYPEITSIVMIRPEGRYTKITSKDKDFNNYFHLSSIDELDRYIN